MRHGSVRYLVGASVMLALLSSAATSFAQGKVMLDDERWVSLGGGLRTSFRANETAPDSGTYSKDFLLDSTRLYVNALLHKGFMVEFNTEYSAEAGEVLVLDAVVKYSANDAFNIWMGRHLPPSDRANLDGPYFLSAFDYPGLVSRYPAIFAGRDNGVLVNGQVQGGAFKYAGGIYEGSDTLYGESESLLYAGRLVYNLLDPEPGYYNSSSYYGSKNVLAIGFAVQHQASIVDLGGRAGDFTGLNLDLLFEKKLTDAGVVTLEGAFYDFDLEGAAGDGSAFLAQAAYLLPSPSGIGTFQPIVRYQEFEDDSTLDIGTNYVIRGHSARLAFMFSRDHFEGAGDSSRFTVGTQFQF